MMATEKRLIDANRIVEVANRAYDAWNLAMATADGSREINLVYKRKELCKAVKAVADDCPTVDAVEVVHGFWNEFEDEHLMDTVYQCSACKEEFVTIDGTPSENLWNYCPNCGAKMDGERKDK